MSCYALIMAAGSGTRMGLSQNKVLLSLAGKSILQHTVEKFAGLVEGIVIVARREDIPAVSALSLDAHIVVGGDTRQRSVLQGLRALPEDAGIVLVHDAARPLVTREVIDRCIASAATYGSGVAGVRVKDTIKCVGEDGIILETPQRECLIAAQTPQAFSAHALREAIERLEAAGITATDDAGAMEAAGEPVHIVPGDPKNIKLTEPGDVRFAEWLLGPRVTRMGYGYDAHKLVPGRPLVLCGVQVPHEKGLLGHSDADVALHALMDALLGAAALGDIGTHFPDSDNAYRGISSLLLLGRVAELLRAGGYATCNVDVTIVAQRPKIKPYRERMIRTVAEALGVPEGCVSIKATTTEGMGFEGQEIGISAHAVATIYEPVKTFL